LPVGEVGELAIGGYQLASEYINRLEQTATAFINTKYGRLYRTGDKARMNEDGTFECLGRISEGQVKLRGQRIELGEVEQAVLRTTGCHGAVAAVISGSLIVFCTVDEPVGSETRVLEACRSWLPAFMVPADVVSMPAFPQLPSGKVDRARLKADYSPADGSSTDVKGEQFDGLLSRLLDAARITLGKQINANTNLSGAGMDSLQAIRFSSNLRDLKLSITTLDVLRADTLCDLRTLISRQAILGQTAGSIPQEAPPGFDLTEICRQSPQLKEKTSLIERILPCIPVQAAMLAETILNPEAYCNMVELTFPSTHTPDLIRACFLQLAAANDILRTGFLNHGKQFIQVVWREWMPKQVFIGNLVDEGFSLNDDEAFFHPFRVQIQDKADEFGQYHVIIHAHHAVFDGWSVDLMLDDLDVLLRGSKPPARPSFDSVLAYHLSTSIAEKTAAKNFWAEHLLGVQNQWIPDVAKTYDGLGQARYDGLLSIDPSTVSTFAKDNGLSTPAVFQTALALLWAGLMGSQDVVLGNVTSGRTIPVSSIESVIGPCLTVLPFRIDIGKVQTLRDLLMGAHNANRAALAHACLELSEIKKIAAVAPGQQLYHLLFAYQQSLFSNRRGERSVKQLSYQDHLETSLLIEVEPTGHDFSCRITYHCREWSSDVAKVLHCQFDSIVKFLISNPDQEVMTVRMCFPSDLLSHYNIYPTPASRLATLPRLIEGRVDQHPERTAICFARAISHDGCVIETLTYEELDSSSNRVARLLLASGVEQGSTVAVVMEKSTSLYVSILGVLKAGCTYLPLLPTTPFARTAFIVRQATVRMVLTDTPTKTLLQTLGCELLDIDTAGLGMVDDSRLDIQQDHSQIANIIYTSGTTGTPKGVCITHENIVSNLNVLSQIYPFRSDSRLLQSCSQAFDVSVFEIFFAWTQGMCLCSAINDVLFADLEHSIRSLGVSHLSMTPTVAGLVDPKNVPGVAFLVTSGEPMTHQVASTWSKQLYQGYGPSEVTNICTVKKMSTRDNIRHLGHAFGNTSTVVLYPEGLNSVPVCAVGELCFGGEQVAAGYLRMSDLTERSFIQHKVYGRLYRSGDLGRMLPDGSLIITGRVDDQVKLRGNRIELGEINSVLGQINGVHMAATLFIDHNHSLGSHLVSFFSANSSQSSPAVILRATEEVKAWVRSVRQTLRSKLPSYMVPSYLIPVSAVPTTSSGKLDKRYLHRLLQEQQPGELEAVGSPTSDELDGSAWSQIQIQIADAISKFLSIHKDTIGLWTPFQSLGLDSLSAIGLARNLRQMFGWHLSISDLLQNASVAHLSNLIEATVSKNEELETPLKIFSDSWLALIADDTRSHGLDLTKIRPCMPLQEAMLAASSTQKSYVNNMVFRLKITPGQTKDIWDAMIGRHDVLRSCFVSTTNAEHAIAQVVLPSFEDLWLDTTSCSSLKAVQEAQRASLEDVVDSFRPPVSLAFWEDESGLYLSFHCHHALYDGGAIDTLLHEIELMCHGKALLPTIEYDTFLERALQAPDHVDEFWQAHLEKYKPVFLTQGKETPQSCSSQVLHRKLGMTLSDIERRIQAMGLSLLSVCQTAWACTLRILMKTNDVCFGNIVSGRTLAMDGLESLVAPCFNTLPLRVNLSRLKSGMDIMKQVQTLAPGMLRNQFTPLRRIQRTCFPDNRHIFDTLLLLQPPKRPLDDSVWSLIIDEGDMDVSDPVFRAMIKGRMFSYLALSFPSHVKLHLIQCKIHFRS
jgi:ferricrocin synthase